MDSEELERRLTAGESLACPDCDMFYPETEECEFVCCENPFEGPTEGEILTRMMQLTEMFHKRKESCNFDFTKESEKMKIRKELATWKDRLNEKDDLTEKVSFFWIKESLLPLLEQLQNEIDAINEKLSNYKIE